MFPSGFATIQTRRCFTHCPRLDDSTRHGIATKRGRSVGTQTVTEALKTPGLKANERLVFVILAHYKNEKTGKCNPSISTIARGANISERQAHRIVNRLEKLGLIGVHRHRGRSSQFQVNPCHSYVTPDISGTPDKAMSYPPDKAMSSTYDKAMSSTYDTQMSYEQENTFNKCEQGRGAPLLQGRGARACDDAKTLADEYSDKWPLDFDDEGRPVPINISALECQRGWLERNSVSAIYTLPAEDADKWQWQGDKYKVGEDAIHKGHNLYMRQNGARLEFVYSEIQEAKKVNRLRAVRFEQGWYATKEGQR